MPLWLRHISILLIAALATAAAASVLQTQMNLHSIAQMGVPVGWGKRAALTAENLARFGPVMFGFALAGGVLALALQVGLRRSQITATSI